MKNILLALLFLAPWLASAFPVNTNRFTGKAADSAPPGFDAVLWQWSGYDDQYLIFEFSDVQFSNAGVRLSYPVRGATYLDYASANGQGQIATTNVTTIIYETFTNCYGRVPAGTNTYAGYSNGVITTTVNDPSFQYGDVVDASGLVRVAGTNSINASSVPPACVVFVASNYTTFVPDYGVTTNAWIGSTSVVTNIYVYNSKKQVINDPTFSSTQQWGYSGFTYQLLYPTNANGAGSPAQGRFRAVGGGADAIRSLSQSTMAIYTSQYQVVVSYYVQQNVYNTNSVETNSITYVFADQTTTVSRVVRHTDPQPRYVSDGFYITPAVSSTPSFVMNYIATTNAQIGVDSIRVTAQAYSFVSNGVTTVTTNIIAGSNVVKTLSAGYVRNNGGYSSNTVTYYQYKVAVPRTNIPPDGLYYTEVLAYETTTNQARSLLKGQISIAHSLYANTNYATWVSPSLGRYTFLNQIEGGAQVLAGAGIEVSTTGTNITIQATGQAQSTDTNALPKPGGLMSGDIDFTNAGLTSLDFATFDAAPTGAIAPRRLQWNSDRSTLRLGVNNINMDIGQQLMLYARNEETNTLSKGEVVFLYGATGDNPSVRRASSTSESLSARTIGIMAETVAVNGSGFAMTRGTLYNVDTSAYPQGAPLYLGANGTYQTNLPIAPLHGVFLGVVERSHASVGQIYVAVQNYQELRELSDVFINGPSNNYVLTYVAASNRWEALPAQGGGAGSITNLRSGSSRLIITNGAGPEVSFGLNVSGLATGTPVYEVALPDLAYVSNKLTAISSNLLLGTLSSASTGAADSAIGNIRGGLFSDSAEFRDTTYGNVQLGNIADGDENEAIVNTNTVGSIQRGRWQGGGGGLGVRTIIKNAAGAEQAGFFWQNSIEDNEVSIEDQAHGATQRGAFYTRAVIGPSAYGAMQLGFIDGSGTASNLGVGAIQLMGSLYDNTMLTTANGAGSILLGPGTNSVAHSVKAAGGFYGSFIGDGGSITNVNALQFGGSLPSAYVSVASFQNTITNYARFITTTVAPTGATASGLNGELRVDATNLYMYIGRSNKWIRIPGSFSW